MPGPGVSVKFVTCMSDLPALILMPPNSFKVSYLMFSVRGVNRLPGSVFRVERMNWDGSTELVSLGL